MKTFYLSIIACDRVFYEGQCVSLTFPGYDGEMTILANHEQMTTTANIGNIKFRLPDGSVNIAVISDGLVTVESNHVTVLVYSAERPEEIDEFRAQAALERAQEQLREKQSIMEYHVSQASLSRAMARLSTSGKYKEIK